MAETKWNWTDLGEWGIRGQGWNNGIHPYGRLPDRAEGVVTESVWNLGQQSAGLWVDFESDAPALRARCVLRQPPPPEHHYIKYLDLYARDGRGRWRWAGVSRYGFMPSGETPLIEGLPSRWRSWRLYLPLTYAVERIEIGLPEGAAARPAPADPRAPVAIYGTSIVHGCGHLSRPGMCWPSILGRRLDWPVLNLGFSGSARMEPELATLLAELDPALWVIDPLANMSLELVDKNAERFLRILLAARPRTPLLLMGDRTHAHAWLLPGYGPAQAAKQAAFRAIHDRLRDEGFSVFYLEGAGLIGEDGEGTTDGSHPSDLGAMRYADAVAPVVEAMLHTKKQAAGAAREE